MRKIKSKVKGTMALTLWEFNKTHYEVVAVFPNHKEKPSEWHTESHAFDSLLKADKFYK